MKVRTNLHHKAIPQATGRIAHLTESIRQLKSARAEVATDRVIAQAALEKVVEERNALAKTTHGR